MDLKKKFIINILYWGIIAALVFCVIRYLIPIAAPFFVALIATALARPVAKWLSRPTRKKKQKDGSVTEVARKVRLPYKTAAVICVILLYLALIGIVAALVLTVLSVAGNVASGLPNLYTNTMKPFLFGAGEWMETKLDTLSEPLTAVIESVVPGLLSSLGSLATGFSGKMISYASSLVTSLPSRMLLVLICMIASVFMAVDMDAIIEFFRLNLPERTVAIISDVKNTLADIVWSFVRSYFLIFLITTSEITIGLLLIGYRYSMLIGMVIAIFDAFPIVGSGMILLPWSLITIFSGSGARGLALFILYIIVVGARQVIEPRIVGRQVGLRPIVTLFCMYVGNKLFGVIGLFGLPIAAAIASSLNKSKYAIFKSPLKAQENAEQKKEEVPEETESKAE